MDLFSTLRVIRRRWYAIAPVLVLAIVAEVLIPNRIPVTYRSTASVLLVPPSVPASEDAGGVNPYLMFNQSMIVAASVVARSVDDPTSVDRLVRDGATAAFTITPPVSNIPNPSPIVDVSVEGADAVAVRRTAEKVVAAVEDALRTQQKEAGAPASSLIRALVVNRTIEPVAVYGDRYRAAAAIAALSVVLLVGMAFLVEAIEVRRASRSKRRYSTVDPHDDLAGLDELYEPRREVPLR